MANRTATLYIHYKKADGTWAYAKPIVKANGRIKPLYVLADGKEKHHPEARYKVVFLSIDRMFLPTRFCQCLLAEMEMAGVKIHPSPPDFSKALKCLAFRRSAALIT